jgi:inorganic pyrophosphatase
MPAVINIHGFWLKLDELVAACDLAIDRPRESPHPCFPSLRYPLDHGYLPNPRRGDREEIDIWVGSLPEKIVSAILCTVDLKKQDAEVKLLLGCTPQEARKV